MRNFQNSLERERESERERARERERASERVRKRESERERERAREREREREGERAVFLHTCFQNVYNSHNTQLQKPMCNFTNTGGVNLGKSRFSQNYEKHNQRN